MNFTLAALSGDNGILTRAADAKEKTDEAQELETERLTGYEDVMSEYTGGTTGGTGEGGGTGGGGNAGYVSVTEIFQNKKETDEGYDATKLHIGDFVNYDAGTWTAEEISQIQTGETVSLVTANGSATELPGFNYQFGGFGAGTSRNGNAVPYSSSYNYVQETTAEGTKQAVTGWRVFDVDESTGAVTLISAGCPEDYNHQYGTNNGYISEYILTGNVNSSWGVTEETAANTYTKRNWSKYVNTAQKATEATPITKAKLDNWYSKYMGYTNADTYTEATFQSVYGKKYESMVDNYSDYWLSSAGSSNIVNYVHPDNRAVRNGGSVLAFGVRLLVSLSSEVKLSEERVGTKTVTSRNTDYTYNVWDLN